MEVAEVAQRGAVLVAHTASKVWIVEVLVTRRLGHVLKNAQALLDGFLALGRHVAPIGQYFILNVVALLRRHLLPDAVAVAHILLLLRRQLPEALLILDHALALFGAEPSLLVTSVGTVVILRASRVLARGRAIGICFAIESWTIGIRPIGIRYWAI